jgi:Na+/H+ antiporter NhaC
MAEKCEDIKELKKEEKNHVPWAIFIWAMGFLLVIIGWFFLKTVANESSAVQAKDTVSELKIDVRVIQTDVSWIRQTLEKSPTILRPQPNQ